MLLIRYYSVEKAWGDGTLWIDLGLFGLKGMPIIGYEHKKLSAYDKKFIEDFARGGSYLEIFRACEKFLDDRERLVLGIEHQALFVYAVEHHGDHFNVVRRARVGLFYGRDPKELASKAAESFSTTQKTYSKNPRVHSFLSMFKKEEIEFNLTKCLTTFDSISGAPLSTGEKSIIGRATKLKILDF